jgi:hypothetical protein
MNQSDNTMNNRQPAGGGRVICPQCGYAMGRLLIPVALAVGDILLGGLLLGGCTGSGEPMLPVFDVPSLVGSNADQVILVEGPPDSPTTPSQANIQAGIKEWNYEYKRGRVSLVVTYHLSDKSIRSFFVTTEDRRGATSDKARLLALGRLKIGDPRYRVEFVPVPGHPGEYTGVKAVLR